MDLITDRKRKNYTSEFIFSYWKTCVNTTLLFALNGLFILPILALGQTPALPLPAFPGAEGFGAFAQGGRGGQVMHVTNLQDAGEGSLRACAEATGPRICVFDISGIVELIEDITVEQPYLTIAGQTAPGEGITIRGMLDLRSHDLVIRHVRVRPGPRTIPAPGVTDAIQIVDLAHDIILDHVSLSWATDEVLSLFGTVRDITIQWSIISESLNCPPEPFRHHEGCHGKGVLIGPQQPCSRRRGFSDLRP